MRVLHHEYSDANSVEALQDAHGRLWVTFSDVARFMIDRDLVIYETSDTTGLTEILCEGWVMAMVLFLRDHIVLHASAVTADIGTYAFVGNSGTGKSTVAALLCRDGARLIADDVARIDIDDGTVRIHRGATALRLREAAFGVADVVSGQTTPTCDSRLSLAPTGSSEPAHSLDAVLIPRPDRSTDSVE